jgi:hypothetical protein
MITDDYIDYLTDEIYKKDVEIARLNAEVARLLELMEMSGRLMKLLETRARPDDIVCRRCALIAEARADAKTEQETNGENTCLT